MPTLLDSNQVIRAVYDEPANRLRVDAIVSGSITITDITISHTDDSIRLGDGTSLITATTVGPKVGLDVNIVNSDLQINIDASDGDSILAIGTEDGTTSGTQHVLKIDTNKNLHTFIHGTDDGSATGTSYGLVSNLRQQILNTHDLKEEVTYAGAGTKAERITRVDYTSSTFSGFTVRKDISYTHLGGSVYIIDDVQWSIV